MTQFVEGKTGQFEIIMGLEIHAQVQSKSKLFSGAATAFGAEPNSQVSYVDAGFPGMLPVLNEECVSQAIRTGLALNAQINLTSVFARKNYFYPDLPSGYQISQYDQPIVGEGKVSIDLEDGSTKEIGITRLHLEMDAGKSMHDQHPKKSYIDLNRSGVALMEIVTEPDLRSTEEVAAFIKKLRSIVRYIGTCDGNMEQGNLRCDVNVSVRKPGEGFGTRCEIKNMNSVRFIGQAIEYEAQRQVDIIEAGGSVDQETRLFDTSTGETRSMRSKEEAHDYRYFPDPDLLPLTFDQALVDSLRADLIELPDARKARFINDMGLTPYDASVLVAERETAEYFETAAKGRDAKLVANWIMGDLFGALNKAGQELSECKVKPEQLGQMIGLISDGTISGKIAKDVFADMFESGKDPAKIVEEKGLQQISDTGEIEKIIADVLAANPAQVEQYKAGKDKMLGFFVGQVMKATGGKANPAMVNDLIKKALAG